MFSTNKINVFLQHAHGVIARTTIVICYMKEKKTNALRTYDKYLYNIII